MKPTIFVRPNLKMFLLGALLLLVIQHLISGGLSQASGLVRPAGRVLGYGGESEIQRLLEQAKVKPSSALFLRISHCYEGRQEYKKALAYLRKAEKLAQSEDTSE